MRDINRIEPMMDELAEFWKAHPDWRFGQLIANCIRAYDGRLNCDPFFIEDDDLLKGLRKMKEK